MIIPSKYILPPKSLRKGIIINVPELRLYAFLPEKKLILTYPVALGREGWRTPLMQTHVSGKMKDPSWIVPESIRNYSFEKYGVYFPNIMPPGPNNPLGKRAIYLNYPSIPIHGTNNASSIGTFASSGCIRMHNHR